MPLVYTDFDNPRVTVLNKPKISAYFICYNEAIIMPHLLRHYFSFCDKITICDNLSDDNTLDIIQDFKDNNVKILKFGTHNTFNDAVHAKIKNEIWKQDVGQYDYIIVADADEFLYHPNLFNFLREKKEEGYAVFRSYGYHMIGDYDLQLKYDDNIFEKVKYGVKEDMMNKYLIFDCNKVKDINLSVGSHRSKPVGEGKCYNGNELKLLHFKFLGLENHLKWCAIAKKRLSDFNKQNKFGLNYLEDEAYHINEYKTLYNNRVLIV